MLEVNAQLTPQAVFAIMGGMIGACSLAIPKAKRDGYFLTFVLVSFGIGLAVTVSDYFLISFGNKRLFAHFTLSMTVGAIGGSMFMTIRAIAPEFADSVVRITSSSATKALKSVAESRIAKGIAYILGKGD